MEYMWMGGKNRNKLLSCQRKTDTCGRGVEEKEESIVLLLTFKALKSNVFTIIAYKDVIFMHPFRQSATNQYQSISIYLSIVIENRYQSITTWIFAIDWSSITNINRLTDIDWYWLISIVSDYASVNSSCAQRPPLRGICPPCQSRGWGICKFCAARGPGICQPRGHERAFNTHAVSYQNITRQKVLLEKKQIGSPVKDRSKLERVVKACFQFYAYINFLHYLLSQNYIAKTGAIDVKQHVLVIESNFCWYYLKNIVSYLYNYS